MIQPVSTPLTAGSSTLATVSLPFMTETVPVAETKTAFEFDPFAVETVHGIWQKIVGVSTGVSLPHSPELVFPR
jgi:hypothetical protein